MLSHCGVTTKPRLTLFLFDEDVVLGDLQLARLGRGVSEMPVGGQPLLI
jgi:hypothetical protein